MNYWIASVSQLANNPSMELHDYADLGTIATAFTSAGIACFVYAWTKENVKVDATRKLSEDLRHYNEMVIASDELQQLAMEGHRWGKLEKEDVIRMYRYFILLNIPLTMYEAKKRNAIDATTYQAQMNTMANTTFHDRAFIKDHVFPRGYPKAFKDDFNQRWSNIDKDGTLPCT